MPEWILKGGEKPPKEMVDFLADNRENYLRVNMEVESSHERLRRSFHALLKAFFKTGEWSCNGAIIHTLKKFKGYYKYEACDRVPVGYAHNGDEFYPEKGQTINDALEALFKAYPDATPEKIDPIPKSWTKMNKKQKSAALNLLLTEIRLCMTNDKETLTWVAKITCDIEMLNDINYHKNIGE